MYFSQKFALKIWKRFSYFILLLSVTFRKTDLKLVNCIDNCVLSHIFIQVPQFDKTPTKQCMNFYLIQNSTSVQGQVRTCSKILRALLPLPTLSAPIYHLEYCRQRDVSFHGALRKHGNEPGGLLIRSSTWSHLWVFFWVAVIVTKIFKVSYYY